jgi:anti-sigma factor ChrR (cupin superfamily)
MLEETPMPDTIQATAPRRRLLADTPSPPSHYLDVVNMPWETTKFPGIEMKMLYAEQAGGLSALLFRLAPGAEVPLHEHTGVEMTYILEGSLEDDEGVCTAGNFVWRPAGNTHVARAPNGAVILGVFMSPNHFAAGQKFFTEALGGG